MWLILLTTAGFAGEVWRAELENGTVSFTDSPSTTGDYERFNVDEPPPKVGKGQPPNLPPRSIRTTVSSSMRRPDMGSTLRS